jgi:hypothetical protein
VAGLVGALILVYAGELFALNGPQWEPWRWACFGAAVVLIVVTFRRADVAHAVRRVRQPSVIVASLVGAATTGAALYVMGATYSDPYAGLLPWPRVLALLALAGFALFAVAATAATVRGR